MTDFAQKQLQDRALYYTEVIAATAHSPLWQGYGEYLSDKERGLRPQALARLEKFLVEMEQADFPERRRFVTWLLSESAAVGAGTTFARIPLAFESYDRRCLSGPRLILALQSHIGCWEGSSI